jgi:hypothetical protein
MFRKYRHISLALAVLATFACNHQESSPTQVEEKNQTGTARMAMPKLPVTYLADSNQTAFFVLTIEGENMMRIQRTWNLATVKSKELTIDAIPAGMQHFHGELIRIDLNSGDSSVTHQGDDSVAIVPFGISDVHLYLKSKNSGTAHICVEVEGWPSESSCNGSSNPPALPPPALPLDPKKDPFGCWTITVQLNPEKPDPDSVLQGRLSIVQIDSNWMGEFTWSDGSKDTALAPLELLRGGVLYFGNGVGSLVFKATKLSDSAWSGTFLLERLGIMGNAVANRTFCEDVMDDNHACFHFSQVQDSSDIYGRIAIAKTRNEVKFYVSWSGLGRRMGEGTVQGDIEVGGMGRTTTGPVEFEFPTIPGVLPNQPELVSAFYFFEVKDNELQGVVSRAASRQGKLGTLVGLPTTCFTTDFQM